ncbi:APS kinase/ATP sulfurlyase/pyrophosphatase fusion protein [Achlya hypogyna]|uniref:APS kinase/ATP sulfurlyase/pyrophosphatase fusion protein n=1 Tax=Achlya hypogyna TaxID=1202772 RepID=A0A1V9ZG31_ACHHY|nr:APS kinase/ATP sulfurlyase/pyrophosphatase fusion protein [Achlya hypogyna]
MGKEDSVQYASVKMHDDDEGALSPMDIKSSRDAGDAKDWRTLFWWVFAITPYVILLFLLVLGSTGNLSEETDGAFCAAQRLEKLQMTRNVFWDQSVVSDKARYAAIGQKGATIWMTGLSGSGKSTIGRALEAELLHRRVQVYRLDGDNVRIGLNRDLGFSAADRAESVRRVGETAALFAAAGTVTIVGLVSPYRADRDEVRALHEKLHLPFYEVFVDTPLEVVMARDIKGLYKKAVEGKIQHFTGISAPYEAPETPDMTLFTPNLTLATEVDALVSFLEAKGIFTGVAALPEGYPGVAIPDGGNAAEAFSALYPDAPALPAPDATWPRVLLRDEDLHWVQVLGEGWAAPLRGFMREGAYLQSLHFSSVVFDADNLTAGRLDPHSPTNFSEYSNEGLRKGRRVNLPIPIVLPITAAAKAAVAGAEHVVLVDRSGAEVAVLSAPEVFAHRKEERIARTFGALDEGHPYVAAIRTSGDFLLGGEVALLRRVTYGDGLDGYRLTPAELRRKFEAMGADAVLAFQTRNPTHAGHAYLMNAARARLLAMGFKRPVLWLSPLGGWTKTDDVPLNVRVQQHAAILEAGMLDANSTVLSIWPSPMVYAGPREVQWHAKSRKNAGASFFIVGRDPAGIKRTDGAQDDMYAGDHGRYVLHLSPGLDDMNIMSFPKVMYDVADNTMKPPVPGRPKSDFLSISGSRMRLMARKGLQPCTGAIPADWETNPTCVPPGFMAPAGWDLMIQYYQRPDAASNVQYAVPFRTLAPRADIETMGTLGTRDFELYLRNASGRFSAWHDVPLYVSASVVNLVVEIEKGKMEKMEVNKARAWNPIAQDVTKTNATRYYMYGVPFFNYGMLPQTWEDPALKDAHGHGGDNDPLDVIEVGDAVLPIGSVVPVRVLGSLELIDQDEVDHKIIALALSDPAAARIHTAADLLAHKPEVVARLVDWLKNYKRPEGKPANVLAQESLASEAAALDIVAETHARYAKLRKGETTNPGFWLGA